jgi:carbamoyl-phosphate synthase large subunit
MHDPTGVLVTGAGAPGLPGTLYALRHNPDGRPVRVIGVDIESDIAGRFLADKFHVVPPPESAEYVPAMLRICAEESAAVVLPQTTREIVALSAARDEFTRAGIGVMVSGAGVIRDANDKWRLIGKAREIGLPCPAAFRARTEEELTNGAFELGYPEHPVAVKPPVSNGMRGVRILRNNAWNVTRFLGEKPSGLEMSLDDLLRIFRRGPGWPEMIVMEYLPGAEYTVDAFRGATLELALPRLREAVRSGITFRSSSEFRDDVREQSLRLARYLDLRFAFGLQFKVDAHGIPKILECNPRIQGTMVASAFSGANLVWFGVRELLGEPVEAASLAIQPACFYRVWDGIGVCAGIVHAI